MEFSEGQLKFIETWGKLSNSWGVSKSLAQLHALLLISPRALNAQEVQDKLNISMGNVNTNLRQLINWELVYKVDQSDSRKIYYQAEKDMGKVFICILKERKKRELTPLISVLDQLVNVEAGCKNSKEFCKVVRDIKKMANTADSILDNVCADESNWLIESWMKI